MQRLCGSNKKKNSTICFWIMQSCRCIKILKVTLWTRIVLMYTLRTPSEYFQLSEFACVQFACILPGWCIQFNVFTSGMHIYFHCAEKQKCWWELIDVIQFVNIVLKVCAITSPSSSWGKKQLYFYRILKWGAVGLFDRKPHPVWVAGGIVC